MPCRSCPSTNWTLRNNSDNVSAVLRSNYYNQNSDRGGYRKKKCCESAAFGGNNCYCQDNPIRPKLFSKPNSCICVGGDDTSPKTKVSTPKIGRPCKFLVVQENEVEKVDKKQMRSRINFFERYDSGRTREAMQNNANCAVKSALALGAASSAANSRRSCASSAKEDFTVLSNSKKAICPRSYSAKTKAIEKVQDEDEEKLAVPPLKDLREFRDEHFFETHHTTEDLLKDVPEHICVHRFQLDERKLPKPVNCDAYGESRCRICEKPMEHTVRTPNKDKEKRERSQGSFPKFYKYGLAPRKIYMGSGDVRMEVIAEAEDEEEKWERNRKALRNFQYANTCALRFQKGVV